MGVCDCSRRGRSAKKWAEGGVAKTAKWQKRGNNGEKAKVWKNRKGKSGGGVHKRNSGSYEGLRLGSTEKAARGRINMLRRDRQLTGRWGLS